MPCNKMPCNKVPCIKMRCREVFLIFAVLFICLNTEAKNLGRYGTIFEIEEADFLSVIESRLENAENTGEIARINNEYQNKIREQVKRPTPVKGIEKALETKLKKFDPTTYLEEDIVTVDSSNNPKILYKKGTPINPLEYQSFVTPLLFIDGDDESQLKFARDLQNKDLSVMTILVNGEPGLKKVGDKEYYYYFDQFGVFSQKFGINRVPSLVFQEGNEKLLTIKEVGLDEKN